MPIRLSGKELRQIRLVANSLAARDVAGASTVVARLGAVQAQEKPSSFLAIRARIGAVTPQPDAAAPVEAGHDRFERAAASVANAMDFVDD